MPPQNALRHRLGLKSHYNNGGKEPNFTNYTKNYKGTLDYILYSSKSVEAIGYLQEPSENELMREEAFPNSKNSSDHIPLLGTFAFINDYQNYLREKRVARHSALNKHSSSSAGGATHHHHHHHSSSTHHHSSSHHSSSHHSRIRNTHHSSSTHHQQQQSSSSTSTPTATSIRPPAPPRHRQQQSQQQLSQQQHSGSPMVQALSSLTKSASRDGASTTHGVSSNHHSIPPQTNMRRVHSLDIPTTTLSSNNATNNGQQSSQTSNSPQLNRYSSSQTRSSNSGMFIIDYSLKP